MVKDSSIEGFKALSKVIKEEKERTAKANEILLGGLKTAM